jgi:hypothetical protein
MTAKPRKFVVVDHRRVGTCSSSSIQKKLKEASTVMTTQRLLPPARETKIAKPVK